MNTTTITRNLMGNDITIKLTEQEMERIYEQVQLEYDKVEVKARLEESEIDYDMDEIPGDLIETLAKDFRERMTGIAETMGDGRIPAMENTFKAFKSELEEYEKKDKVFTVEVTLTMKKEYTVRAKDEDDAERIFTTWSERNSRQMTEDLTNDAEYIGEWDTDGYYEDGSYDPENADIGEGDI